LIFDINFYYSILTASSGQASTQTPQSIQASTSTTALSAIMLIASLGHSATQDSQPVHFCSSILAGIYTPFQKTWNLPTKYGMLQNYVDITTPFFEEILQNAAISPYKAFLVFQYLFVLYHCEPTGSQLMLVVLL